MAACVALVALAFATMPTVTAGEELAQVAKDFSVAEAKLAQVDNGSAKPEASAVLLGRLLGESRARQPVVTSLLLDAATAKGTDAVRLVEWRGVLEAYLSAAILGLDGDSGSMALSDVLHARLRREIDLRKP